jgi:hypothetical protein
MKPRTCACDPSGHGRQPETRHLGPRAARYAPTIRRGLPQEDGVKPEAAEETRVQGHWVTSGFELGWGQRGVLDRALARDRAAAPADAWFARGTSIALTERTARGIGPRIAPCNSRDEPTATMDAALPSSFRRHACSTRTTSRHPLAGPGATVRVLSGLERRLLHLQQQARQERTLGTRPRWTTLPLAEMTLVRGTR